MDSGRPRGTRTALASLLLVLMPSCSGSCLDSQPDLPSEQALLAKALDAGVEAEPLGHLEGTKGAVSLERDGKKRPAQLGYLFLKDAIETGSDGEASVRFAGRLVEVGPDARVVLNRDGAGLLLEVVRGLVLSRVPKETGAKGEPVAALSILTPFGLTRLGSGQNEVSLQVGPEGAKLEVLLGKVELLSRTGEKAEASAGDKVVLSLGQVQVLAAGKEEEASGFTRLWAPGSKVEVRQKGTNRWKPVSRRGAELGAGDGARVRSGRAVLDLPGSSRLTFPKGAELTFDSAGRSTGVDFAALALKKGRLVASLASGRAGRLLLGDLELRSELGGNFLVARVSDGFEVTARTGDVLLRRAGKAHPLRAGQILRLSSKGADVRKVEPEAVALPSRQGLKVFHNGMGELTIDWESAGEEDFRVVVASDPRLQNVVLSGLVHEPRVNVPAPQRGSLHWKITTADGKKELDRGSATFAPEPVRTELLRLRNEVPEGSETTTIYYQDKPPAVSFTYAPEAEAVQYRVRVYLEEKLDRPVAEITVDGTTAPLGAGVLGEGVYRWSVTPISATGEELRGGNMTQLELVYDNALPSLVVHSPPNGELVKGDRVPIKGIAPVGARVLVNGSAVNIDDKGRFNSTVAAMGQPPRVVFRISMPAGGEAYTVRTLRRAR